MTIFDHSFSLIALILGLALVEVLSSFVRALRDRHATPIGWLTPMLAVFVIGDITTYWGILWEVRLLLPSVWPTLGLGVFLSSIYYAAASLVFPAREADWENLDAYFMRIKRVVFGLILSCFMIVLAAEIAIGRSFDQTTVIEDAAYIFFLIFTALAPWKSANILGLLGLNAVLALSFFLPG